MFAASDRPLDLFEVGGSEVGGLEGWMVDWSSVSRIGDVAAEANKTKNDGSQARIRGLNWGLRIHTVVVLQPYSG